MVSIIANGAQFDVSGTVRERIFELLSSESDEKNIVFIVPDQFEFETEKLIYRELLSRGLLTRSGEIHIETFSKLSRKILKENGEKRIRADETIKNIIMHKAVRDQKSALTSLNRQADKAGFCRKMLSTVSMLNTAGFVASKLDESEIRSSLEKNEALKNHRPFVEKLLDVSKIQTSYEGLMGRYIDDAEAIDTAADFVASESLDLFENADVFVDYFNDFTSSQLYFLQKLTEKVQNITFGFNVVLDDDLRDNLFFSLRNQINRIIQNARDNDVECEIISDIPRRFPKNSPLSELSEKLFSNEKSSVSLGEACELVHAADAYDEIDYTAAKIKELCLDKGYLYRDIAVLCADPSYAKLIKRSFDKYEIPYFVDIPESILYQPLVSFFLALLNVLRDFSVDTVLSLIKTGFMSKSVKDEKKSTASTVILKKSSLTQKEISDFEAYIFEWNLQTKHLKNAFDFADPKSATQKNAEAVRAVVIEPLLRLKSSLKGKDGAEITRLIYDYAANEVDLERVIRRNCFTPDFSDDDEQETEQKLPDTTLLRMYQQLWGKLVVILETLERELQGEYISLDEYYQTFADICSGTSLAKPPQYQDCVIVGDIDRTRANNIKSTFILGTSYEKFPSVVEGAGVFSENETEFLIENISEFGLKNTNSFALKTSREQYCLSFYRAYKAISLADEKLTIVSSDYDTKGSNIQKSLVVSEILNIFPDTKVIETACLDDKFYCRSIKAAKQRYANKFAKRSKDNKTLSDALNILECKDFLDKLDAIRSLKTRIALKDKNSIGHHELNPKTAKRIFDVNLGATAVEKLNLCKFNYFCEFGLKIREKTQRNFNKANRGNVVHYILQNVLEAYCHRMDDFFKLTRKEFAEFAGYYLDEYLKKETNHDHIDDLRTKYLFANLAITAVDVLIMLQAEFSLRKYRPKFFELDLAKPSKLNIVDSNESGADIVTPKAELYLDEKTGNVSPKATTPKNTPNVLNVQPLGLTLDDGTVITIHGRVDRVDLFVSPVNNESYVRIIDYKSSAKSFDSFFALNGIKIQMLLYLFAICDANTTNPLKVNPGEIGYLPSSNSLASKDKMSAFRLLAFNHHINGLYVQNTSTGQETKDYFRALFEKIALDEAENDNTLDDKAIKDLEDMLLPKSDNTPNDKEFSQLREDCTNFLKASFKDLFSGKIDAFPTKYSEPAKSKDETSKPVVPCKYCRFNLICGNNLERVNAISKPRTTKGDKKK